MGRLSIWEAGFGERVAADFLMAGRGRKSDGSRDGRLQGKMEELKVDSTSLVH